MIADKKKLIFLIMIEILVIAIGAWLYFDLLSDFEYKFLLPFPIIFIVAYTAIAVNAFYDSDENKKRREFRDKKKRYDRMSSRRDTDDWM